MFLTLSGTRSSSPLDEYATVPTDAEKSGDFSAPGLPAIYDPTTFQQFTSNGTANVIPSTRLSPQAKALLQYFPEPNLPGTVQQLSFALDGADEHHAGRGSLHAQPWFQPSLGSGGRGGLGGVGRRTQQNQGLRQSINFNYNWSHSAADKVNIFPQLGGKTASDSDSVQAGYTVGYHRITSIFNASWNRSNSHATNFFTNGPDIATSSASWVPMEPR